MRITYGGRVDRSTTTMVELVWWRRDMVQMLAEPTGLTGDEVIGVAEQQSWQG